MAQSIVHFYAITKENGVERILGNESFSPMCANALAGDRLITLYMLDREDEWFFARNNDFMDSDPDLELDSDDCYDVCGHNDDCTEYYLEEDSNFECSSQCSCTDCRAFPDATF
ncbi:OLC1v1012856C1 [Oldenlandia corymbosa var. corymbosa]|uniref:OLC1v1012856C1 n=1 Tax=Oldenlandia corymbosa var. corymbosa TaxID=529605 RepID=A0AAV1E0G7_OLDCO|nr:OLC1v1012856C1 [Oldenlandia corymbosa var. corymbosa]